MNTELLRKVQRAILREPKRYDQNDWHGGKEEISPDGSCGTVGCIAGWACAIEVGLPQYFKKYITDFTGYFIPDDACTYLDISGGGYAYESSRLFHAESWPKIFSPWIRSNGSLKGRPWTKALLAVIRIEIFIRSKGKI